MSASASSFSSPFSYHSSLSPSSLSPTKANHDRNGNQVGEGALPLPSADSSSLLLKPSPALLASSADSPAVAAASSSSSDVAAAATAEAGGEADTSHLLSSWEMLKLCIPVIPSQLGWAVGEALLIPYLMSLGLAETTANSIWLVNPLVGFFVQPIIGAWSDRSTSRWGRRRPFLLLFHLGIVAGLLMIGFAPELHSLLLPHVAAYDREGTPSATLLVIIFTGCVLMELSNDLLTIPSRALLNDCLTGDHRVLTRSGWKSITRMRVGDVVLSFNIATCAMEWKPVRAVESHAADPRRAADALFRMQGSGMDVIATRDHRMLLARIHCHTADGLQQGTPVGYEKVNELLGLTDAVSGTSAVTFAHTPSRAVVRAGLMTQPAVKVVIPGLERVCDWWWQQDRQLGFLQFLGFWLGDGHLNVWSGVVGINQEMEVGKQWLEQLLRRVFPRWWHSNAKPSAPGHGAYTVRCPPLYSYLRLMAVGPLGYNPRDPQQLRSYPHFTKDEELAAMEQQSDCMEDSSSDRVSTWTEDDMLAAFAAAEDDADSERGCRCRRADWEDGNEMLLCSGEDCQCGGHLRCAGLTAVPEGDWLCPACSDVVEAGTEEVAEEDDAAPSPARRPSSLSSPLARRLSASAATTESSTSQSASDERRFSFSGYSDHGEEEGKESPASVQPMDSGAPALEEGEDGEQRPLAEAGEDRRLAQQLRAAGEIGWWNNGLWIVIDDHWFHLKRWLGGANVANVYSRLSRKQAVALLDGFCRADGEWRLIQYDDNDEPTGQWRCSSSSFPLIDHLMLIGQLAGAAVDLALQPKAGTTRTIAGRRVTGSCDHWALLFSFTRPERKPMQTAPLARPVAVSDDLDARGYYQYEDDGRVYCISVKDNSNFLTQRLSIKRLHSDDVGVRAQSVFVGNCLPEEQIDQGNAWFSAMNSLGAVIGLTMCFLPLNEVWPLRLLGTQMRATFVMCIAFIMTSNLFTMTIDEWTEEEEEEEEGEGDDGEEEGEGEAEAEGEEGEGQPLLGKELEEGRLQQQAGKLRRVQVVVADETVAMHDKTDVVVEQPEGQAEAEEGEGQGEGEGEEEEEEAEEPSHMSLLSSLLAFRLLPPALLAIWVAQFSWWLVVMQISFWWTTWVGIDVFGGDPLLSSSLFYEGVTFGIIGTLVHSIVSFFASQLLTYANNMLGVTRVYHASAVLFSLSTMALWWLRSREASMVYMVFTGALYPVINTNPFILIEVYTGYEEEGEGGEGGEEEAEEEGAGEDEADTSKEQAAEPEEKSAGEQAADAAASAVSSALSAADGDSGSVVAAGPLSDFLYQSQNETDSGSSISSSSSSSDSETDSPLFAASSSLTSLAPPAMKRPLSDGAMDSVSESEGSQSETEYKASPTQRGAGGAAGGVARNLNLSQYGYDLSVSVNEGYAFSDGESVPGAAAGGRRRETGSPSLSPYGSPLPLASLLPLALESASHGLPSSPDTPLSPDSPLTPLVSPGMVATVAAQHAQGGVAFLPPAVPSSESLSPQSPALSFDAPAGRTAATELSLPPAATASFRHHGSSPSLAARINRASSLSAALSPSDNGGPPHGTSIYQPEHAVDVEEAEADAEAAAVSGPSSGSSAESIETAIARRSQPRRSSKSKPLESPLHSPSSVSAAALLPAHPLATSEMKDMEGKQEQPAASAAAAEVGDGEDEEEAEEELDAAEDAEIEYLKASTHRGVLTAIMNLSMGLSQIISATVGGVLISWWGDITIVFFLSGLLSLIVNAVVMAYGWSSVAEEAAEEEAGDAEAEDELAEKAELREEAEAERQRLEQERRKREEKREEEERKRRAEQEAVKRKDRDRILRRFMPGEHSRLPSRETLRDQRSIGLLSPEPEAAVNQYAYGSFGSAAGVPIPSIPHRRSHRHAHRHRSGDAELAQASSSVPSSLPAAQPSSSHRRHRHRHHGHRHRASSPSELDRQHAQAYLMHALAQMSRLHSSSAGGSAHSKKTARPGTAGKRAAAGESKRPELSATTETTPLLSAVPGPSPMLHASSQPVVSTPSSQPAAPPAVPAPASAVSAGHAAPLHSLLSHPSHQRLLYEITVLLHYYHVHHISLLPPAVQDRIFLRLRKQLRKLRRRLPHHGRIDADITSRRGLSGRYAMGEEVKMERERLHLMKKRRRRRIRRKERERRDREDRLHQTQPTTATADTQQQQPQTP